MSTATVAKTPFISPKSLDARAARRGSRPSIFARLLSAIEASGRRRADAAIGRYIQVHGGRLTDNIERDIERFFMHR